MKKSALALILLIIILGSANSIVLAQAEPDIKRLPAAIVKDLKGANVNSASFGNDGKPYVLNFWATWCKPCINELINISDVYEDWVKETGVKIIAVSIDDSRNIAKVAPLVNGKGWSYEVYIDQNQDLKRAMNVNNIPHTFLFDGKGNMVHQHNSYTEGDELKLYEKIKKLTEQPKE
jgi:thiol-disulfide isomerase/thioredoxin